MAKRVVNLAVIAYRNLEGGHAVGRHGTSVDVHPDHLDAFDALNGEGDAGDAPEPQQTPAVTAPVAEPKTEPEKVQGQRRARKARA